jgi:sortase A
MKRRILLITLAALLFLAAGGITVYPLVSNYINDKYQSTVQTAYTNEIRSVDEKKIEQARQAAQAYNNSLSPLRYSKEAVQEASADYESLLNLTGSGIMGYVEVPLIRVNLPIYHGTGESVLEEGVGHLLGSSLPIGGEGSHAILTGHSGVAGKRLFSDLEQLQVGDVFYLHVLGDTLAYQVKDINCVLPYETELLVPVAGKDLCTLVTCYPYGVNTHRLLVRGSRIPYEEAVSVEEAAEKTPVKSTWKEQYYTGLLIGGCIAAGGVLTGILIAVLRKKRRSRHAP